MIELTTSWKEEGLEQGLAQGRLERLALILRLLRRRCGPLPEGVEERVRELPGAKLEELAVALPDFGGLSDLERWLGGRDRA